MTVDAHFIITTLLGLTCGVLGWLGRELWAAVQALRKDLSSLEVKLTTDYVRYDRLQDAMRPILEKLDRIQTALQHKVDKS